MIKQYVLCYHHHQHGCWIGQLNAIFAAENPPTLLFYRFEISFPFSFRNKVYHTLQQMIDLTDPLMSFVYIAPIEEGLWRGAVYENNLLNYSEPKNRKCFWLFAATGNICFLNESWEYIISSYIQKVDETRKNLVIQVLKSFS